MLYSFRINKRDPQPIYLQIPSQMQAAIEDKSIAPGALLPPAQTLCEHLGISKMTLRQAYSVLERKGYLETRRGVGTYALGASRRRSPVLAAMTMIKLIRDAHEDDFAWSTYPTHVNPAGTRHQDKLLGITDVELVFEQPWGEFRKTVERLLDCPE